MKVSVVTSRKVIRDGALIVKKMQLVAHIRLLQTVLKLKFTHAAVRKNGTKMCAAERF
jgi:hypothetical protein